MSEFSLNKELENLIKQTIGDQHLTETEKNNTTIMEESAKNRNFFQNKNAILKKENNKPYTTTRIKSKKFLSNISYVGVNKEDFYKKGFIFDVYSLVVKNLNLFSLERKTGDQNKQEMIYVLWKECVLVEFYKYICLEENFLYLNEKNVLYAKVSGIVSKLIEMGTKNFALLRNSLWQFKNIFQYVYSSTYPDTYWATEQRGFSIKSSFYIV